jgi:DtxR family transcriptional regulator, Mn-dependent transcriptional regulator
MNSLNEENYLKALLNLSQADGEVNVKDLSKHLDIKMPSVTSMMKKMADKGLVHYESYKPLRLTEKGITEAALIIRKHRLTEMFLVEKMGFRWDEVHDIAEQMEHIKSPEFFLRMDEILGFPKFDPHGSPIPDKNGKMLWTSWSKLSECQVGDKITVVAVTKSSEEFLKFLNSREIALGLEMIILSIESFDQSMVVSYGKHKSETLSATVCERLLVSVVK